MSERNVCIGFQLQRVDPGLDLFFRLLFFLVACCSRLITCTLGLQSVLASQGVPVLLQATPGCCPVCFNVVTGSAPSLLLRVTGLFKHPFRRLFYKEHAQQTVCSLGM